MAMSKMKPTKGTRETEYPGRFGFEAWNLDAREKFDSLLDDMIAEGFKIATEEYELEAWFIPEDPLNVHVRLPCGPNEDEGPAWSFNLIELVENEIEIFTKNGLGESIPLDEEGRDRLGRISHALGKLQDMIDKELTRGPA